MPFVPVGIPQLATGDVQLSLGDVGPPKNITDVHLAFSQNRRESGDRCRGVFQLKYIADVHLAFSKIDGSPVNDVEMFAH